MFKTYSLAVIGGLEKLPASKRVALEDLGIPTSRLSKIQKGTAEFSDRELDRIERASGKTAGQLAASVTEPNGGPLTDLAELGAKVHKAAQAAIKAQSKTTKRATKPRRATHRQLV